MRSNMHLHHKIEVKQKVEVPTLLDHRVTKDIFELHSINILRCCKIANPGELEWRRSILHRSLSGLLLVHLQYCWACSGLMILLGSRRWLRRRRRRRDCLLGYVIETPSRLEGSQ